MTNTLLEVTGKVSNKSLIKWVVGWPVTFALVLVLGFNYVWDQAYADGVRHGEIVGYDKAQDEKATAAWANTQEGKAAWRLAEANPSRFMSELEGRIPRSKDGKVTACQDWAVHCRWSLRWSGIIWGLV